MYERSEEERLGCHGHPVEIKYRLRKVVTRASSPSVWFPSGIPARSTHAPLYPEVLHSSCPDPCQPPRRVEGVRQATQTRGGWRRWGQTFTPLVPRQGRPTWHTKWVGVRGSGRAGPGCGCAEYLRTPESAPYLLGDLARLQVRGDLGSARVPSRPIATGPTRAGVEGAAPDPAPSSAHSRGFEHQNSTHQTRLQRVPRRSAVLRTES